jgi:hypothetical protein
MKFIKNYENYQTPLETKPMEVQTRDIEPDATIDDVVGRLESLFPLLEAEEKMEINNYFIQQ